MKVLKFHAMFLMGMVAMLSAVCQAGAFQKAAVPKKANPLVGVWAAQIEGGGKMILTFAGNGVVTNELRLADKSQKIKLGYSLEGAKIRFQRDGQPDEECKFSLRGQRLTLEGWVFGKGIQFTRMKSAARSNRAPALQGCVILVK